MRWRRVAAGWAGYGTEPPQSGMPRHWHDSGRLVCLFPARAVIEVTAAAPEGNDRGRGGGRVRRCHVCNPAAAIALTSPGSPPDSHHINPPRPPPPASSVRTLHGYNASIRPCLAVQCTLMWRVPGSPASPCVGVASPASLAGDVSRHFRRSERLTHRTCWCAAGLRPRAAAVHCNGRLPGPGARHLASELSVGDKRGTGPATDGGTARKNWPA